MDRTAEEIMSATFTLLVKLGIFTTEDVKTAISNGYTAVFDLVDEKYRELIKEGKIKHNNN